MFVCCSHQYYSNREEAYSYIFFLSDSEVSSPFTPVADEDSVVFSKLTYLGCASVNAPRSEVEALRMMSILRSQCQISLDVTLSVPNISEGTVR